LYALEGLGQCTPSAARTWREVSFAPLLKAAGREEPDSGLWMSFTLEDAAHDVEEHLNDDLKQSTPSLAFSGLHRNLL